MFDQSEGCDNRRWVSVPRSHAVGDGAGQTWGPVPTLITGLFAGRGIAGKLRHT